MSKFRKIRIAAGLFLIVILTPQAVFAAFPSLSARTKNWGNETLTDTDLEGQFDLLHTYFNDALNASTGHAHTGATNQGPKLSIASALTIASQATGDLIYASSASVFARLGIGSTGQVLSVSGGLPAWTTVPSPPNYRSGMFCMQASTTTMTVSPGVIEVNGTSVAKTSNTTLTITTAGNWAGGSSLQATNTTGYIGIDSSGNIKMHTTAPTHADYALSVSAANNIKRYASWSSTTYRIIGWFRMNGTGSGELAAYGVSNLADGDAKNVVEFETGAVATGTTLIPFDDTIPQNTEGDQYMSIDFVPTNVNDKLKITVVFNSANSASTQQTVALFQDSTANALAAVGDRGDSVDKGYTKTLIHYMKAGTTSLTTFKVRAGDSTGGTMTFNGVSGGRIYGGVMASSIRVEEITGQLT